MRAVATSEFGHSCRQDVRDMTASFFLQTEHKETTMAIIIFRLYIPSKFYIVDVVKGNKAGSSRLYGL